MDNVKPNLKTIEFFLLSLMIISLPSIEAPKNIFLVFYVLIAFFRQLKMKKFHDLKLWDSIFLTFILSNLICTLLAGIPGNDEWKGFRVSLTILSVGWLLSKSNYSLKQSRNLYLLLIASTLPPLLFGFWQLLISHSKDQLELHSVGHVNHSAIYLLIIFGAILSTLLSDIKIKYQSFKPILILMLVLTLYALIIGLSRASAGMAILLASILITFSSKSLITKLTSLGIIILVVIMSFLSNSPITQKQLNYQSQSNVMADRLQIWNAATEATRIYPVFGIGMFNWKQIKIEDLRNSVEKRNEIFEEKNYMLQFGHAHSLYFSTLVEKGIVGFSMLIIFMAMWLRELIKNYKFTLKNKLFFTFWGGAASAWVAIFGVGLVNSTFNHEKGILACLFLGLYLNSIKLINLKK